MTNNYRQLYKGLLLIFIDINILNFDILPDVIGAYLVYKALNDLYESGENSNFLIGKYLAVVLIISSCLELINAFTYRFSFIGDSPFYYFISMCLMLANLSLALLIYQGIIETFQHLNELESMKQYLRERHIYALVEGFVLIVYSFMPNLPKSLDGVLITVGIISFLLHIRFLYFINLRSKFRPKHLDLEI